ncbi:6-carboxytetrahydropterin synthase QueD [Buchnera aphidicola]|uniref:6-carboxytetrahydropterin synthase QueD n=1 Tax=Buchnera aphidicola TaxID=9 RepID=UPI00346476A8
MSIILFKDYTFEAAHKLPNVAKEHKCYKLHGHSFLIRISIKGEINNDTGFILDFKQIDDVFKPIQVKLNHSYLNVIKGLENPTIEILSRWIWKKLKPKLNELYSIKINETFTSGCIYKE